MTGRITIRNEHSHSARAPAARFAAPEARDEGNSPLLRHEHGRHLGTRKRRADLLGRRGAHHDGTARQERLGERLQVVYAVEDERLRGRHGGVTLDRDLRHTPAATAPPALPHRVSDPPGSSSSTCTSGASSRSWAGVPLRGGKVP